MVIAFLLSSFLVLAALVGIERVGYRHQELDTGRAHLLAEIAHVADAVLLHDASAASQRRVGELLDRYAELSLAQERCLAALIMAPGVRLVYEAQSEHEHGRVRHARVLDARLRARERCVAQSQQIADEMEYVGEHLQLLAMEAARPQEVADDGELDRRLERFDDEHDEHGGYAACTTPSS
jgi:hypothetical protein